MSEAVSGVSYIGYAKNNSSSAAPQSFEEFQKTMNTEYHASLANPIDSKGEAERDVLFYNSATGISEGASSVSDTATGDAQTPSEDATPPSATSNSGDDQSDSLPHGDDDQSLRA